MRRVVSMAALAVAMMWGGSMYGQATGKQDVPQAHPGEKSPDLQQQNSADSGRAVPDSANAPKSSSPAGPDQQSNTEGNSTSGKKNKKKPHNKQTHGAQKHNPDNQS